jgi:hypothetical protein
VDEDLVGTASARLLAVGVPRRNRADALRLLGLLGDHADADGRVRMPFPLLVAEFDLDADQAARSLEELTAVEIVVRSEGLLRLAAMEPPRLGGIRLADFLALAELTDDDLELEPVLAAPPPPPLPGARRRPKAVLALATLALLLVVALAPDARRPRLDGDLAGDERAQLAAPSSAKTVAGAALGLRRAPTPDQPVTGDEPGDVVAPPEVPADADEPVVIAAPPVVDVPLVDLPKVVLACPADGPVVTVTAGDPQLSEDAPGEWTILATGTLRNPTTAAITVDQVDVVVGDGEAVPAFQGARTLGAGAEETWTVSVPAGPVADAVSATLGTWRWADPSVAETCPVA